MYKSTSMQFGPGVTRSSSRIYVLRSPSFSSGYSFLPRSSSSVFGRALASSSGRFHTPPLHSVAVQRSTPHYSDRYPYVRYSYGSTAPGLSLVSASSTLPRSHYSNRDVTTKRYLDTSLTSYGTAMRRSPIYGSSTSVSSKLEHRPGSMPVDDAVDMYKKRCMTIGTLSKYWLSPKTWKSRREKEYNLGTSVSRGSYSYASRYTPRY